MTALIALDVAKQHLRVEHTDDDDDITLKIEQASEICLDYIKQRGDRVAVTDPPTPVVPWDETTVPKPVQAAAMMMLSKLYDDRSAGQENDERMAIGYLTPAITALLHRFRDPAIA